MSADSVVNNNKGLTLRAREQSRHKIERQFFPASLSGAQTLFPRKPIVHFNSSNCMASWQQFSPFHAHWAVRMNWKNRSLCFALLGLTVGTHLHAIDAPPLAWGFLALQFFIGPHLQYLCGCMAAKPRQAEVRNMLLDALGFGAWAAALGFPLWISFSMFVAASMNLIVFASWQGWVKAIVAMGLGVIAVACIQPLSFQPETAMLPTVLCMVTLVLFLSVFAQDGFLRATRLYQQRAWMRAQLGEIQALKDLLAEQAVRDALTGLFNRRMLEQKLPQLMQQCARRGTSLVVMLLDMDKFKAVNDSQGHAAGDQLLLDLSHHLMQYSRSQDVVFRYGGDEFLVLFPETSLEVASARAQLLCETFAQLPRRLEQGALCMTLSCGLASFPVHGQDVQTLLQHTDEALYQAKAAGRNQVAVYGESVRSTERSMENTL